MPRRWLSTVGRVIRGWVLRGSTAPSWRSASVSSARGESIGLSFVLSRDDIGEIISGRPLVIRCHGLEVALTTEWWPSQDWEAVVAVCANEHRCVCQHGRDAATCVECYQKSGGVVC
jgi:hypothetical protein